MLPSLIGIIASSGGVAGPTVTGGTLYTSGGFNYRVFTSSGTLGVSGGTLTCDVLISGGGGGASGVSTVYVGAGADAGIVTAWASQAFSSNQTVTIGAGGAGNSGAGSAGSSSSLGSLTANGASGASASLPAGSCFAGSGAGGAGTGINTTSVGGAGTTSVTNWGALTAALTATGQGVANFIAGGGGGGASSGLTNAGGSGGGGTGQHNINGTAGTVNTGSGGGGTNLGTLGGNGGSGLIIVRYPV